MSAFWGRDIAFVCSGSRITHTLHSLIYGTKMQKNLVSHFIFLLPSPCTTNRQHLFFLPNGLLFFSICDYCIAIICSHVISVGSWVYGSTGHGTCVRLSYERNRKVDFFACKRVFSYLLICNFMLLFLLQLKQNSCGFKASLFNKGQK